MKLKFGIIAVIMAMATLFIVQKPAHAGWVVKNGLAIDVVQTCRDGGHIGLATFSLELDVLINVINHDTGEYLFGGIFHPYPNYVPEINFQNSGYYSITWENGQLLPVGTVVDYHPVSNSEFGIVEDCYMNEPPPPIPFTGELTSNGKPANGKYDLRFRLYDSPNWGKELAPAVVVNKVKVQDGEYQVELDFGAVPFEQDAALWLAVEFKAHGAKTFEPLPERVSFH